MVYRACEEQGIEIPDQLSVAACNDSPFNEKLKHLKPVLTRARHAVTEYGELGARTLLNIVNKEIRQSGRMFLMSDFIKGESCCQLRRDKAASLS